MSETQNETPPVRARMATLKRLREHTLPLWLDPVPVDATLRAWFNKAGVRRCPKVNPPRGGAEVYYSVADVEKMLRASAQG